MKGKLVVFTIIFSLCLTVSAQEDNRFRLFKKKNSDYTLNYQIATWGDVNKKGGNELANVIVAQDKSKYYTWSGYDGYYYKPAPILRGFTHNGDLVFSSKLEDDYVQFIHFNDRLFYISSADGEDNTILINIQEISKVDGTPIREKQQLFSTKSRRRNPFNVNQIRHSISPDGKHLALTLLHKSDDTQQAVPNSISILALNQQLAVEWKMDDYQIASGKAFHLLSMALDDEASLFLATQIFEDADAIDDGHVVKLYTIDEQSKRVRELALEYWGITIVDFLIRIQQGRILGVGVYNNTANYSRVKGLFMLEIDTYHNEFQRLYSDDYPQEIISAFLEKRKVEEYKEIGQVYLNDVLWSEDGSVTLFLQEGNRVPLFGRYPETRLLTIDDSSPEPHSYGNLLVTKLSGEGKLLFTKVIKKKLTTSFTQQRMGAYSTFSFNGNTYLFYYKGRFPNKSNPIIKTKISDRGTVTSERFLKAKSSGSGLFLCPRLFRKSVREDSLILYSQMMSKFRYGKIKVR